MNNKLLVPVPHYKNVFWSGATITKPPDTQVAIRPIISSTGISGGPECYRKKQIMFWHVPSAWQPRISKTKPLWITASPIHSVPWESVSLHMIIDLPSSHWKMVVLVILDIFSMMSHFFGFKKIRKAPQLAEFYLAHAVQLPGLPLEINSDEGPQFDSRFWKALHWGLGVRVNISLAYHPESVDRLRESVNVWSNTSVVFIPHRAPTGQGSCHGQSLPIIPWYIKPARRPPFSVPMATIMFLSPWSWARSWRSEPRTPSLGWPCFIFSCPSPSCSLLYILWPFMQIVKVHPVLSIGRAIMCGCPPTLWAFRVTASSGLASGSLSHQ